MVVALGAVPVLLLGLLVLLGLGHVVQIAHDLTAGMELGRLILGLLLLGDLTLLVVDLFLHHVRVLVFLHRQGDDLLGDAADFLGSGLGGDDLAVPDESGGQVPEHCNTLVSGLSQFPVCHCCFLLINLRCCAGTSPTAPVFAALLRETSGPGSGPSSSRLRPAAPAPPRC